MALPLNAVRVQDIKRFSIAQTLSYTISQSDAQTVLSLSLKYPRAEREIARSAKKNDAERVSI